LIILLFILICELKLENVHGQITDIPQQSVREA
jgi:hypothetical protein